MMTAACLLCFGIVINFCTAIRKITPTPSQQPIPSQQRDDVIASMNASLAESTGEGWGEAKCYKVTGGTCNLQHCRTYRNAKCSWGKCFCEYGCVGADGACRPKLEQYKVVASNFRLRNDKWKKMYLYAPRTTFFEQLRVTEYKGKYADLWNLYEVPGPTWLPNSAHHIATGGHAKRMNWGQGHTVDEPRYVLSPVEFPEFAAAISDRPGEVGSMYSVSVYHLSHRHLLADGKPFNPGMVFNNLCRPPQGPPKAVEILGLYSTAAWYIHHASYLVYGWIWGDPKDGGYWEMESESGQPIDITLPLCGKHDHTAASDAPSSQMTTSDNQSGITITINIGDGR